MGEAKKNKILIVDDVAINIMSLAQILRHQYDIIVAKDGNTAIEIAKKSIPDIILLDIIMPGMDGFTVLTKLKRIEITRNIPVIFITGLDSTEDEEKGFCLGAVDYITKPFHNSIVKARVKTHVRMAEYIRKIEQLSMIDTLTELPNRRSFDNRIDAEWKHAIREKKAIGVLMLDIDNFKIYNDTYGHSQGDLVLQTLSGVLKNVLKRSMDFASRWGGEEFIVLLPDTDLDGVMLVAEQIRQSIEQTVVIFSDGTNTRITISIGINSIIPSSEDTINDFISKVDKALYNAKKSGKNCVCSS